MNYTVIAHNVHINDSYKVRGRSFQDVLELIHTSGGTDVFDRGYFSLKMEWAVHNFLYKIHFKRERTKDVDLDNPCDLPEWIYKILGCMVWIIIR